MAQNQNVLNSLFLHTGIFIFAIMNVKNKDEMQPSCFFAVIIQRYNQYKIEHVFQTKAAIKILEDCDVEPMLFVFKHSNLISHYHYILLISRFMRFISNMQSLFKGLSKFIAHKFRLHTL